MKLSEIPMGSKLELEVYNSLGEKIRPPLISELEWIEEEEIAFIAAPIYEGILYPLHVGTEMTVCVYNKNDLYKFKADVLHRGIKDNIALLKIAVTGKIIKIQRRQFFRFDWSIPIQYRVIGSMNPEYNEDSPYKKAITRDMSGGGVSIGLEEKVELDKFVECQLPLPRRTINFFGKVVRSVRTENEEIYKYEIGVLFRKIENRDREEVIKYIFQEQRKLRKKGLI